MTDAERELLLRTAYFVSTQMCVAEKDESSTASYEAYISLLKPQIEKYASGYLSEKEKSAAEASKSRKAARDNMFFNRMMRRILGF
jgi:hypothetical protein